ncbi:MAG: altronate dehydratase family protein [Ferrovibrio sp.]|uniref:UxaA family hydrolase n=1 Tax=Ferrovibrio sp. TaxID=1917215 RepID=UPI002618C39A|nr:altronate dehydratase family protein [Ferrovibrio sp.]MCW0235857.1 altronate dehydratase family protein [Ferrovibrio sp.]
MLDQVSAVIRLNEHDNVVVARSELQPGMRVEGGGNVTCRGTIPAGHKVATAPIGQGEAVRKYNQIIGFASVPIEPGEHVHSHNLAMGDFSRDYAFGADMRPTAYIPEAERASFQGFMRENGRAGTRNYLGVVTSVNCSATVARYIADHFKGDALRDYPNIDGVVAIVHGTGCGMADKGEGFGNLQRTLWGYAQHVNFAGVMMLGLGCEVAQIDFMMEAQGLKHSPRLQSMTIQDSGGTRKTVERGIAMLKEMLPAANALQRTTVPASHLTLCLQCGGSDGYSGITANPALGAAADLLVRHGGTAILSETPEIYGAEHLLTRRAESRAIGEKLIERIRWWEEYCERNGGSMDNNPSPGNKKGGLTTILEKSLGAAAKGGTTNLRGVFKYAEPVDTKGFVFMDTPGYDPCSATGQIAGGGNIICFTTGRGSVFGAKPVPSIKLATNSAMYRRMEEDMDINCGAILDEGISVAQMGEKIFDNILTVASGTPSKSEELGFGDAEFVPWQIGATM